VADIASRHPAPVVRGAAQHARHLRTASLLTAALCAAVATLNLLVDPYGAYRIVVSPSLDAAKPTADSRIALAERARHETFDTLLLGSSRTLWGLRAEAPALGPGRHANLAILGATMAEVARMADLATEAHPPRRPAAGGRGVACSSTPTSSCSFSCRSRWRGHSCWRGPGGATPRSRGSGSPRSCSTAGPTFGCGSAAFPPLQGRAACPSSPYKAGEHRSERWRVKDSRVAPTAFAAAIALLLVLLNLTRASEFIYWQF